MTAAIRQDKAGEASSGNRVELRTGNTGRLTLALSGHWRIGHGLAAIGDIEVLLDCEPHIRTVRAEDHGLEGWDSSLVSYLLKVSDLCAARKLPFDSGDLPAGVARLLTLARAC
jgi:phospholipid/cholesterol/gamma-HCH transport system permease protein